MPAKLPMTYTQKLNLGAAAVVRGAYTEAARFFDQAFREVPTTAALCRWIQARLREKA